MRRLLSVFGLFVIVTLCTGSRCNDVAGPARTPTPTPIGPTPSPTASLLPVVTAVEPSEVRSPYWDAWTVVGKNLNHAYRPAVTFESGGISIERRILYWQPGAAGEYLVVNKISTPGRYTPCVTTLHGKGCGNFLVTVP